MTWLDVFVTYMDVVGAVVSTAPVWWPLLLGVASLAWGVRRVPRRRRTRRPDSSGQDPDSPPDIPALLSIPQS